MTVTLDDIQRAYTRVSKIAYRTSMFSSRSLSDMTGARIYLKAENLQRAGSFKIRGAVNKLSSLTKEQLQRGVVAASAGNHAQGLAVAAREVAPLMGLEQAIHCTIVMPRAASLAKITATRGYGARVVLKGENYEGKYVIQTEEKHLSPVEAVRIYKELSDVERAFSSLKDVIEMRPIYHRTDVRVQAHIFVATLAFLLHRAIEKKLKAAGLDLSSTEALQLLRSVRVVEFTVGTPEPGKRSVTRGTERAARVLAALGITDLDPPPPPATEPTIV